ncbi:hypothetical protein ACYJ3L_000327 [Vibrio alginolyticus]|uniref:hypothetical protein n=1 Tax=Vibrio alginolyticus TaxID=663 RepID=UPI002FE54130
MLPKYKDIADLVKKGATFEAQEKIIELREAALALQEENLELRETIAELEKKLANKNHLKYDAPFYWKVEDGNKDGPFCQMCQDSDGKSIRLQTEGNDVWRCFRCTKTYFGPNYEAHVPDFQDDHSWP